MSGPDDIETIEISIERIETVLWSEEQLDGIFFDEDEDGVTVLHAYGGPWTLHLFLVALAWTMGPELEPKLDGYQQIYHSLARLIIDMSHAAPDLENNPEGFSCKLPNIKILPRGESRS